MDQSFGMSVMCCFFVVGYSERLEKGCFGSHDCLGVVMLSKEGVVLRITNTPAFLFPATPKSILVPVLLETATSDFQRDSHPLACVFL